MIVARYAFEIARIIVDGVIIDVVDFVAARDRSVVVFPYLPVKRLNAAKNIATARRVVSLMRDVIRERITTKSDAVENNGVNLVWG